MEKVHACLFVLSVCVLICVQDVTSELTLGKLNKKVNGQVRKLTNLMRQLGELQTAQEEMKTVQGALQADQEVLKTAVQSLDNSVDTVGDLEDKPECPGHPGFYLQVSLGSCYRVEPLSVFLNATDAASLCATYSPESHLVSIESAEEQDFLKTVWKNKYGTSSISRYWTAASFTNGQWLWTFNKEMKFVNWVPSTEHNDERFPCMAVYSTENYWWVDVACWSLHAVTCEINM